jgi:hypothetical protein
MKITDLPPNMQNKIAQELAPLAGLEFCWTWTGCINSKGYGCVGVNGKSQLTHRVSYQLLVGPIEAGFQIDHLCENKKCCNPAHLEPVTARTNASRKVDANKTVCVNGHRYTPDNTIWRTRGELQHRQCRQCQNSYGKQVSA